ncbi:MAG: MGMT family protein [Bacteroidetes bacterium]|nr:MGMT family protein [Bacteroidota bacterium]MBS1739198.1 MGMT family protein [Bacteroidota bacterium]MBS1775647.1 MGMT family protein [Bacteroidota bacterium]
MKAVKKEANDIYGAIYQLVHLCPRGRVTSYGAIAAALGVKSGARLVGYAMNNCNKAELNVPAHRVVNRNGMLTGKHHFLTPTQMQELLEAEGIRVENDTVVDFDKVFWDPSIEI